MWLILTVYTLLLPQPSTLTLPPRPSGSFLCQGGHPRLPHHAFCDGYPDCPLGDDELGCFAPQILHGGRGPQQAWPGGDRRNKQKFYSMQNVNLMQGGRQGGDDTRVVFCFTLRDV